MNVLCFSSFVQISKCTFSISSSPVFVVSNFPAKTGAEEIKTPLLKSARGVSIPAKNCQGSFSVPAFCFTPHHDPGRLAIKRRLIIEYIEKASDRVYHLK